MSRVAKAIEELHRDENDLAGQLLRVSDRHRADHEVFHLGRDLARWSQEHVRTLARVGKAHGLSLDPEPAEDDTLLSRLRTKGSELVGRVHEADLALLAELRSIHRTAAGVSLDWEVLAQTAQALGDLDLLATAQQCHPETLRQLRWANAQVKEKSAQAMVAS